MSQTQKAEQDQPRVLSDEDLDVVCGGRKAGGAQHEFLIVKLEEIIIT